MRGPDLGTGDGLGAVSCGHSVHARMGGSTLISLGASPRLPGLPSCAPPGGFKGERRPEPQGKRIS